MSNIKWYGWIPDVKDKRDLKFSVPKFITDALPPMVDHRHMCPPIFDQQALGSCTANATSTQIWHTAIRAGRESVEPARLFIYYNTRILEGTVGRDSGASIRNSIKSVNKYGFTPESLWPYQIKKFKTKPSPAAYEAATPRKITEYRSVQRQPEQLKSALAQGNLVNFGFNVYASFESKEVASTGIVPMPKRGEKVLGGHAVLLVGYDDSKSLYIVQNSWGTSWGDKGYFYLPYDFVHSNRASDFWVISAVP